MIWLTCSYLAALWLIVCLLRENDRESRIFGHVAFAVLLTLGWPLMLAAIFYDWIGEVCAKRSYRRTP